MQGGSVKGTMTLKMSSHYQMNLSSQQMQKSSVTVIRALFSLELEETFLTAVMSGLSRHHSLK